MKQYKITVNGKTYDVAVEEVGASAPAAPAAPQAAPKAPEMPVSSAKGDAVKAPIPGTVLNWKVNVGDTVKAGDTLCILEAMKMENDIAAPHDGVVAEICAAQGASVDTGATLMILG